jgi:hypothetical protein
MPENVQGDIYVRYRLGEQKYKSKVSFFLNLFLLVFFASSIPLFSSPTLLHMLCTGISPPTFSHSLSLPLSPSLPPFLSAGACQWLTSTLAHWGMAEQLIRLGLSATVQSPHYALLQVEGFTMLYLICIPSMPCSSTSTCWPPP